MKKLFGVVNFTDFYNLSPPEDALEFIKNYPTDIILLILCRANAVLFQEEGYKLNCQARIMKEIFPNLDKSKLPLLTRLYAKHKSTNDSEGPIYFTEQAITWLIANCFKNYKPASDADLINEYDLQNKVFDSILVANEIYYKGQDEFDLNTYEAIWHLYLKQQFYARDILPMIKEGSVKMLLFRKFILTHFPNGNDLIKEFQFNLGMSSYFAYSTVYMDILRKVFVNYKEKGKASWLLEITEENRKLIETFAFRPDDIKEGKGFRSMHGNMIPKPIYFLMDKHAVIIDFNFFGFLIDTAFMFNFYSNTSISKTKEFKTLPLYQSFLGKKFYEEFVAIQLFQSIFSVSTVIKGSELNELTDLAIIQDQKDIFLIELKSSSLHYNVLEDVDLNKFKEFINEKFLQQKDDSSKNKGLHQLKRCIKELSNGKLFPDNVKLKNLANCRIFPIIIYTDKVLNGPGVNNYCNDTFQKAIEDLKPNFKHIYPLTMINLDFFISHYNVLKGKPSLLLSYIRDYHKRVNSGIKSFKRNGYPIIFLNANLSFSYFIHQQHPVSHTTIRNISRDLNLELENEK